jgi:hypothetical protein
MEPEPQERKVDRDGAQPRILDIPFEHQLLHGVVCPHFTRCAYGVTRVVRARGSGRLESEAQGKERELWVAPIRGH